MMGRNDKPQKPLFYTFNLDDLVPQDHLLRKIDRFLDLLAPAAARTERRPGRVPADRDRAESQAHGQVPGDRTA